MIAVPGGKYILASDVVGVDAEREIAKLRAAVQVLARECAAWRAWEAACSAMAVQQLNKQTSVELNETADRLWLDAVGERTNMTNLNPTAAAAVKEASGG
jgi:hypothetical protein